MPRTQQSIVKDLYSRLEIMSSNRSEWDAVCKRIAERVWPDWSRQFFNVPTSNLVRTEGGARTEKMLDPTAAIALERFGSIMESMLTPTGGRWHFLSPGGPEKEELQKIRSVMLWYDRVTSILFQYRYSTRANYAPNQNSMWRSLGGFGNGTMFIDRQSDNTGLRYKCIHPGSTYFATNHQGIVDTMFRPFRLSARQAAQKWDMSALPEKIQLSAKGAGAKPDDMYDFMHCVYPRSEYDRERIDSLNLPFASLYVTSEDNTVIEEGGYRTFPFPTSRYTVVPEETYGRSPAMLALPSIDVLQEQKKVVLKQGHRVVDPVILAADDGVLDTFSLRPGAINAGTMSAEGKPLVGTLPTGNVAVGKELMDDERLAINDIFLITLFQILVDTPQMTATEVLERAREKGALIAPTMGRQEAEALGPTIERELDLLGEEGVLPEPPGELLEAYGGNIDYEVEYDSPLSRARQAEELVGVHRYYDWVERHASVTGDLRGYDWIDVDAIAPEMMRGLAIPERFKRSKQKIDEERESRSEQQQIQQATEAAPAISGAVKAAQQ